MCFFNEAIRGNVNCRLTHGSTTQNNAFATILYCGDHHGGTNARILATILNSNHLPEVLNKQDIKILRDTLFVVARHDSTSDEIEIYSNNIPKSHATYIESLKQDTKCASNKKFSL